MKSSYKEIITRCTKLAEENRDKVLEYKRKLTMVRKQIQGIFKKDKGTQEVIMAKLKVIT